VPNVLVAKGDTNLGFISIIDNRVIEEYLLKNIKVIDPIEAVTENASVLRAAGVHIPVMVNTCTGLNVNT
jgi:5'-nucleotidase/UDP-sugar diphosphatase